jgi:calcineurin-like phosphoesterase family protein
MSRDIWITSDSHYNHANIIKFIDYKGNRTREFDDVDQMNECILERWNSVVKPGDIVYHLGDVFFGDKEKFKKDWPKFNGSKRLIVGNHDDIPFLSSGGFFKKVLMWRMFPEYNLMLSHVPLHISSLYRGADMSAPLYNVHGHIHTMDSPEGPYKCVCVEQTNYTPVNIEDLGVEARKFQEDWRNKYDTERTDS